jgi:hypothetical protein
MYYVVTVTAIVTVIVAITILYNRYFISMSQLSHCAGESTVGIIVMSL